MTKRKALTVEDGAYCAVAWAGGQRQIDIARSIGMKQSGAVCAAIGKFLDEWSGERVSYRETENGGWTQIGGNARKALVPQALQQFMAARQGP